MKYRNEIRGRPMHWCLFNILGGTIIRRFWVVLLEHVTKSLEGTWV